MFTHMHASTHKDPAKHIYPAPPRSINIRQSLQTSQFGIEFKYKNIPLDRNFTLTRKCHFYAYRQICSRPGSNEHTADSPSLRNENSLPRSEYELQAVERPLSE